MKSGIDESAENASRPGERVDYALHEAGSSPDVSVRAFLMFNYASIVVSKAVDAHLSQWGLSVPRYAVLRGLLKQRSMTMVGLSRYMVCNASNVNSVVGRLVRDGLVRRVSNPEDGRSTRIVLTAEGEKLARQVIDPHREFLIELMSSNKASENQQFTHFLENLAIQAGDMAGNSLPFRGVDGARRSADAPRKATRDSETLMTGS